jgi:hypothetical protein
MKKMALVFSHKLTLEQIEDAKESLGVEEFIKLPKDLQLLWSNIPPELENLDRELEPIKEFLKDNIKNGDFALVQGDFGATCKIVSFVKSIGATPIYATTKREVKEKEINGKVVKTSLFKHIRFREF